MNLPTRIFPYAAHAASLVSLVTVVAPRVHAQAAVSAAASNWSTASGAPVRLEPLLVTAELWASPLERIPASVTVVDEDSLRAGAIRHFGDLADEVPNLTWTGGTSRPRYFQIRGIGENSQYEGETPDSTVRFLIDDLDFTGLGTLASAFDVRQIEVLRGPQAGAFGANAAGGVVRLVTQAPTPYWIGQVEGSAGGDRLRRGGFAIGGPLFGGQPDRLMARLAVEQHDSAGFRRNVTLDRDTNARDEFTARLRLAFNPGPAWRWDGALLFADLNNGFDEFALDNNGTRTFSDQPGRDEQRSTGASLRGTYTGFTGVRLSTVTSGSWTHSVYSYDDDWTAASYQGFSDLRRSRTVYGEELRLDSTASRGAAGPLDRWTLGAFFSRTDEDSAYSDEDPGNIRGLKTNYAARNTALFGQAAHNFAPATRLIVGGRAERLDLAGRGTRTRWRKLRGTFDPTVTFAPRFDDTLVGGKLTLEHELGGHELAFASVARGYKGGGVNIDARITPPDDPLTYATEYLWNYEAGVRGSGFDQRMRGEFTAFFLQRREPQVRDSAGFGGTYRFFTANARRARVYGVEASAAYALTPEWSLHGSLGLMGSSLDRFILANGNAGGGRRLANTPPYGYTVAARYGATAGWFGQLELVGRGRQFDSNNQDEARRAFDVVNATLAYAWERWTATLWGRNLFHERYDKRVFFFGNEDPDYVPARYTSRADPRQVGVSVAYRF